MAEDSITALEAARAAAYKKHVELNQLRFVKAYIDYKDNIQINTEDGVHNIRYYNNKLQYKNEWGEWETISTGTTTGSGEGGAITVDDLDDTVFANDDEVSEMFNF